ncbi:MAG: hypothetical protein PVG86_00640 [Desulfobacterales bacterium]|jgi:hypothetical protein
MEVTEKDEYSFLLWDFINGLLLDGHFGTLSSDSSGMKLGELFQDINKLLRNKGLKLDLDINFSPPAKQMYMLFADRFVERI